MMKLQALVLVAAMLFLAACEDPAENKPAATLSDPGTSTADNREANTASPTEDPDVKDEALSITPENSKIEFVGSKVTGKHDGGFNEFKGTIDLVDGKAEGSSVSVEIDMVSVFTDDEQLTGHLKTEDFFEVAKYPRSSFKLTKIERDAAAGEDIYNVTGDLELRGVKKAITFPATIKVTDSEVAVTSEFSFNRKDFGIVYAGMADDLIRDRVLMKLDIKTPRKK